MGSKCNRKTTGGVSVPVGFRFHPTEEELVNHYLRKKKQDKDFKVNHIIPEIAFCKHEPWDLPEGVSVPVGFRFHPTEEELVNHYLRKKKQDKDFKVNHVIPEIAFCKHEPWDLPGLLFTESGSWEEANVGGGGASRDEEAKERGGGGGSDCPPANHTSREDEGLFGHSEIGTLGGNVVGGLAMGPGQTEPAPTVEAEVVAAGGCVAEPREPWVDVDAGTAPEN